MSNDLVSLAQLYAYSEFGERLENGECKLLYHRRSSTDELRVKMIERNRLLREKFIKSYDDFRKDVKRSLLV